jgi:hypothetical protein
MKNHTKVYMKHFGYSVADFIPCEICEARAVDIHHIEARGMGGSAGADTPENLMAVCRADHLEYGDKKQHIDFLKETHRNFAAGLNKLNW